MLSLHVTNAHYTRLHCKCPYYWWDVGSVILSRPIHTIRGIHQTGCICHLWNSQSEPVGNCRNVKTHTDMVLHIRSKFWKVLAKKLDLEIVQCQTFKTYSQFRKVLWCECFLACISLKVKICRNNYEHGCWTDHIQSKAYYIRTNFREATLYHKNKG